MSATYPSGPWTSFYKHKYDEWHVAVPYTDSSMRCGLFPDGINPELGELREGTCRLIAAAPELLAALGAVVKNSDDLVAAGHRRLPGSRIATLYEQATAAIAKATGAA